MRHLLSRWARILLSSLSYHSKLIGTLPDLPGFLWLIIPDSLLRFWLCLLSYPGKRLDLFFRNIYSIRFGSRLLQCECLLRIWLCQRLLTGATDPSTSLSLC